MDTISLKKHIYETEKIEYVLEQIGCNNIQYHPMKEFYSCSNYDGDNKNAINVKNNEYLNVVNWTRDFDDNADLITLVEYNKKLSFIDAVKYLHNILGIKYKWSGKKEVVKKVDPLDIFTKHKCCRKVNVDDIHVLDEELLNDFVPMLYIGWLRNDGIIEKTRKKFGIMYSYRKKRIIIPHRYWLTNELIGYNARTIVENYEEFGIPKYLITTGLNKSLNLYGYCQNKDSIEKKGYCVLYESEKSVLKRDSRNDPTGLALSGKSISEEQVRILLSLNITEIIVALDNDVCEEEIWHLCDKLYKFKKVSYIKDNWDLLEKKDSIADAEKKIFDFLFKYRIVYDNEKHKKYLESLKK